MVLMCTLQGESFQGKDLFLQTINILIFTVVVEDLENVKGYNVLYIQYFEFHRKKSSGYNLSKIVTKSTLSCSQLTLDTIQRFSDTK